MAIDVAMTVTGYSIVDSMGVNAIPGLIYMTGIYLLAPIFAGPFLYFKIRSEVLTVIRSHKLEAASVAGTGAMAYGIILWAYQKSSVVYVSALREFSVIIAAGLGAFPLTLGLNADADVGVGPRRHNIEATVMSLAHGRHARRTLSDAPVIVEGRFMTPVLRISKDEVFRHDDTQVGIKPFVAFKDTNDVSVDVLRTA